MTTPFASFRRTLLWWGIGSVLVAIALEFLLFNFRWWQSADYRSSSVSFTVTDNLALTEDGSYRYTGRGEALVELPNIHQKIHNLYLPIQRTETKPLEVTLSFTDEAHANYRGLASRQILQTEKRSWYFAMQTAGKSEKIQIRLNLKADEAVRIGDIQINRPVPLRISAVRALIVFVLLMLIPLLRPSSPLYTLPFSPSSWKQVAAVGVLIILNASAFAGLAASNTNHTNPPWAHHYQYHKLAEALAHGQVYLDEKPPAELANTPNPYNPDLRAEALDGKPYAWDTAYYNGKYYVYFGIVPELLFYFPYYLLTGRGFPTYLGVFYAGIFLICGVFALFRKMVMRWFPKTPFLHYLLISLVCINGCGALQSMACPTFYSIPIITALALSVWGLYFWITALNRLSPPGHLAPNPAPGRATTPLLTAGSLCMALVAGCRPQILMGSALALPLFWNSVWKDRSLFSKSSWRRTLGFCLPYVLVAAGLMYYNVIRFGSPFDFGANYNLTTNDMPLRGFRLGRLPLGLFMYLFQPANLSANFPFVSPAPLTSNYQGETIYEAMYGGVLVCNAFLWIWLLLGYLRPRLKEKKLFAIPVLCISSAVIITIADTEMAGILTRYVQDFSWLLFLGAAILAFTLYEGIRRTRKQRYFHGILSVLVVCTLLYQLAVSLQFGGLANDMPSRFFYLKYLFQFWL